MGCSAAYIHIRGEYVREREQLDVAIAEAYDIGFEEYLDTRAWIFIEWPSKVSSFLEQEEFDTISIKVIDGQHNITLSS